jgi:biopolymer transport protein ExbB
LIRRLALAVILALVIPHSAWAWWDDGWAFRKPLTLDATGAGAGTATSIEESAVLVRLHMGNFGYFADARPDGADVRFIAGDDKTPLAFHIESWDATSGMAFIWVKVPVLAPGTSDTIYMYYGNPEAPAASDPGATYDVNQVLAWHFASLPVKDATSYANQPAEATAVANPGSVIGAGVRFDGAESLKLAGSSTVRLLPDRGLTISLWVNVPESPQTDAVLVELADPAGRFVRLGIDGLAPYVRVNDGVAAVETERAASLLPGSWGLVTAVIGTNRVALYLDGREVSGIDSQFAETGGTLTVGASAAGGSFLTGQLDELTIANTARTADWIKAQFANQGQEDKLVRYGEDTAKESGGEPSYFLISLQNVTLDGWVVIAVLVVMFIASWIIMITKVLTVRRVKKDNLAFLADFRKVNTVNLASLDAEDDPAAEEHNVLQALSGPHDHYQSSTIYHLYHAGIQQVQQRFATSAGAARAETLSPQALDAIRATIDATNVRETQKLNSQMVLLTLAIAGGPFLGLLGTVVGVMITFAVIAATGEVNVNSIAPGIAAALAATVAGLAVAIPALFGYNWLASQIKEVVADNRVFIDEFVTKLAERYS